MPDEDPKFLQIYFIGDEEEQANIRWNYNHIEENQQKAKVTSLETFLTLVRLHNFTTVTGGIDTIVPSYVLYENDQYWCTL